MNIEDIKLGSKWHYLVDGKPYYDIEIVGFSDRGTPECQFTEIKTGTLIYERLTQAPMYFGPGQNIVSVGRHKGVKVIKSWKMK